MHIKINSLICIYTKRVFCFGLCRRSEILDVDITWRECWTLFPGRLVYETKHLFETPNKNRTIRYTNCAYHCWSLGSNSKRRGVPLIKSLRVCTFERWSWCIGWFTCLCNLQGITYSFPLFKCKFQMFMSMFQILICFLVYNKRYQFRESNCFWKKLNELVIGYWSNKKSH